MYTKACDHIPTFIIPACIDSLIIDTTLLNQELRIEITSTHGNQYTITKSTSAQGLFTIDTLSDLPKGLLNPWAGVMMLRIYLADNLQLFFKSGYGYDFIPFTAKLITPVPESYTFPFRLSNDTIQPGEEQGLDFYQLDSTLILQ